jgi:branched-chain amino acid transport system permease protein
MTELFGVPLTVLSGQVMIGLINGSFYALLSLGLAIIFGLLNVINFAHGAFYMVGAFVSWGLLTYAGVGYWPSLVLTPLIVGAFGAVFERTMLRRLYGLDHLFSLLLTFGLALALEGMFRWIYGAGGKSYPVPPSLQGVYDLGFMILPVYRAWVIVASLVICLVAWVLIEKTSLGARLRAATENPRLVTAFGINVPLMLTLTYAAGVGLAGLAGAMAAPIYQVSPNMGSSLIVIVFAVVVIGGMGSIMGSIVTGLLLGVLEGLTKVFFPTASAITVFIVMILVLLLRPAGLFGKDK